MAAFFAEGGEKREALEGALARMEAVRDDPTLGDAARAEGVERERAEGVAPLLAEAEAAQKTASHRADVLCWGGRARACAAGFDPEAERMLGKAVRLKPSAVAAWNALGQLYWRKPDLAAARNCFEGALRQQRNAVSLRCLSMVMRNAPAAGGEGDAERHARLERAAELAKEAVGMDVADGHSWYVLGNAFLMCFFAASRSKSDLDRALKAYQRAEALPRGGGARNPDLFFNRAQVHEYHENYAAAVADYARARDLDPALGAADRIEAVERFVSKLARLVATGAGAKPKRLEAAAAELAKAATAEAAAAEGGGPALLPVSGLEEGPNVGRAVLGRVLAPVSRPLDMPTSFLVVDTEGALAVVSMYNVTDAVLERVRAGDTVRLLAPRLKRVAAAGGVSFPALHMSNPIAVTVNGKALEREAMALPSVSLQRPGAP